MTNLDILDQNGAALFSAWQNGANDLLPNLKRYLRNRLFQDLHRTFHLLADQDMGRVKRHYFHFLKHLDFSEFQTLAHDLDLFRLRLFVDLTQKVLEGLDKPNRDEEKRLIHHVVSCLSHGSETETIMGIVVRDAVQNLWRHDQEIFKCFMLKIVSGYTFDQVSELVGLSRQEVRTRCAKARQFLYNVVTSS